MRNQTRHAARDAFRRAGERCDWREAPLRDTIQALKRGIATGAIARRELTVREVDSHLAPDRRGGGSHRVVTTRFQELPRVERLEHSGGVRGGDRVEWTSDHLPDGAACHAPAELLLALECREAHPNRAPPGVGHCAPRGDDSVAAHGG